MRAYFSQFGEITRLRLSRNRVTGRSKHYAFIEFASATVAKIVAETMDNYLMYGHILKCKFVPSDQLHPDIWKGANRRFKKTPWNKIEKKRLERGKTRDKWAKSIQLEQKRRNLKAEKLKQLMDYEFEAPAIKSVDQISATRQVDSSEASVEEDPAAATNGVQPEAESQPEPQAEEPQPQPQPEAEAQPEETPAKPAAEKPAETPKQSSKKTKGKKTKSEAEPQPEKAAEPEPQPEPETKQPEPEPQTPATKTKTPRKSTKSRKTKSEPEPEPDAQQSQPEPEPEPEPTKPVEPAPEVPKQTPRKTRAKKAAQAEPEPEPRTPVASSPGGPPARRTRSSRKAKA